MVTESTWLPTSSQDLVPLPAGVLVCHQLSPPPEPQVTTVPSTCRTLTPQERALVRRLLLPLPLPPLPWKDEAEFRQDQSLPKA